MEWGSLTTVAIASSLATLFARWRIPAVPHPIASFGLGVSLALLGLSVIQLPIVLTISVAINLGLALGWLDQSLAARNEAATADANGANLRLTFFGDARNPVCLRSSNVATWYAYYTPAIKMFGLDQQGSQQVIAQTPKAWAIFLSFDSPTEFSQILVSLNAAGLPSYQVLISTKRACAIAFASDIPAGDLEIDVRA